MFNSHYVITDGKTAMLLPMEISDNNKEDDDHDKEKTLEMGEAKRGPS